MVTGGREGDIVRAVLAYLPLRGVFAWRNNSGALRIRGGAVRPDRFVRFGRRGSADVIGVLPGGRLLALEVKTATGRLTPEQEAFLAQVRRMGGLAGVVRSIEDVKALLAEK